MRILLIITRLDQGGSAEAVLQIGKGLSKRGHYVKIITGLTINPQESFEEYTEKTGIPIEVISELRREINLFLDLSAFLKLYSLIKKERPLIVHTHTSKAGILGRWAAYIAGVKTIIHSTHGHIFYGYFGNFKTTLFLWMERLTAKITKRITTLTNLEIEDYQRLRFANKERFIAIPYGIDIERYKKADKSREEIKKVLGLSSQDQVVGWAGRLVPVKDCGTFIKAASLIKENKGLKFLIVGDGPERQKLEEMAEGLGIEAIFTGTRRDIYDIMSVIDILVLSSLNEGLGRVLLEAMAAGKPIVATKVGGVPEVVTDGLTGILVPPSDPHSMAFGIKELLKNPERMAMMGEICRKRAEEFDIKIAVDRLESLYEKGGE